MDNLVVYPTLARELQRFRVLSLMWFEMLEPTANQFSLESKMKSILNN